MNCQKCGESLSEGVVYEFKGRKLCDDCYIDIMLGTPDVEISKLAPEVQVLFQNIIKGTLKN